MNLYERVESALDLLDEDSLSQASDIIARVVEDIVIDEHHSAGCDGEWYPQKMVADKVQMCCSVCNAEAHIPEALLIDLTEAREET